MAFLSFFLDTNLAFFALGAYNLNFSGYALDFLMHISAGQIPLTYIFVKYIKLAV